MSESGVLDKTALPEGKSRLRTVCILPKTRSRLVGDENKTGKARLSYDQDVINSVTTECKIFSKVLWKLI